MIRLDRLLSNRGYCSRAEVAELVAQGRISVSGEPAHSASDRVDPNLVRLDDEELDPAEGMLIMLNKPEGYVCSRSDQGALIYELLPERWTRRNPAISSAGRLDKDTTGMLLLTDDGQMLRKLTSPKFKLAKVYEVTLERDLNGSEGALFASGTLVLEDEDKPLLPAKLDPIGPRQARLTITEGRYHQVRRMFAATGNHVLGLHRAKIGGLDLGQIQPGEYRLLDSADLGLLFTDQP